MRNFPRRVSLAAAAAFVAVALTGVSAHAGTPVRVDYRPVSSVLSDRPICSGVFIGGDPRLGPKYLPQEGVLGRILRHYVPLGGISGETFLNRYWNFLANSYRYPPDSGFAHDGRYPNGAILAGGRVFHVGEQLDRFGGEGGAYMSPLGVPFPERALPPTNLETNLSAPQYPCNYHMYRVIWEFAADAGPATPAFQQPGGGVQLHLLSKYLPSAPQTSAELPVRWLVEHGYLQRLN